MQPDFSKYTLVELLDIEKHIDKDAYPDRYKIVFELIKIKENDPDEIEVIKVSDESFKVHLNLIFIAIFWLSAFYYIFTGEFKLKSYSATYESEPFGFFCGVGLYIGMGLYFYLNYIKQYNKLLKQAKGGLRS